MTRAVRMSRRSRLPSAERGSPSRWSRRPRARPGARRRRPRLAEPPRARPDSSLGSRCRGASHRFERAHDGLTRCPARLPSRVSLAAPTIRGSVPCPVTRVSRRRAAAGANVVRFLRKYARSAPGRSLPGSRRLSGPTEAAPRVARHESLQTVQCEVCTCVSSEWRLNSRHSNLASRRCDSIARQ